MTATHISYDESAANAATDQSEGAQFLTFTLADESYGVDILRVQEIKGWVPVTQVPNAPVYVQGVLNLRGVIVPIIDLRAWFNLEKIDHTPITVIIVMSVKNENGNRIIGIVADAVSDVLDIKHADIKPSPDFGATIEVNTDFLNGIATVNDQMVMLLDTDKMLNTDELSTLETDAVH
ncbi:MAG TPA: chemotaxis protein CheW [Acidiferrobacteraceae bacterium]|nr:chemotaxis protein CheW [Acidiferrobacteraceae bacterium]